MPGLIQRYARAVGQTDGAGGGGACQPAILPAAEDIDRDAVVAFMQQAARQIVMRIRLLRTATDALAVDPAFFFFIGAA